jgi:2-C-methyl-D-erythritol 2,4-cyclodiphosphate synthase
MNRVGLGFDAHAFDDQRPLVLGGVTITGGPGLSGHSDADVVAHAVADAILGAAGLGDIGERYPATDLYKDADSLELLRECAAEVRAAGWKIENVDCTIIAEGPRITPYKEQMGDNLGGAMDISPGRISVKATTTDRLGFMGRGEGMGAIAVALLSAE